jgi:hypothetical protein
VPRPSRLFTVITVPGLHIDEPPGDEPRPAAPRRAVRLAAAVLAATALAGCGGGVAAAPLAVQPAGPPVPDVVGESLDVAKTALDVAGFAGGGSSAGTVHPGSFCDPPGSGVSKTGKAMVCAPGSDGRDRWQGA